MTRGQAISGKHSCFFKKCINSLRIRLNASGIISPKIEFPNNDAGNIETHVPRKTIDHRAFVCQQIYDNIGI